MDEPNGVNGQGMKNTDEPYGANGQAYEPAGTYGSPQSDQTYGAPQYEAYGYSQPDAGGAPQYEAYGYSQPDAAGTSQPDATGAPQYEAYGYSQPDTTGTSQPDTTGAPQFGMYESSQADTAGTSQPDTTGTPQFGTYENPQADTAGAAQFVAAGSTQTDTTGAPQADPAGTAEAATAAIPQEEEPADPKKKKKREKKEKAPKEKKKKAPAVQKQGSYIGVEIGNSRMKIVETKKGKLVRFAMEPMPDDMVRQGEIIQWEAMGDLLKAALKKNRFSGKRGALVVPDSIAFSRRTHMPPMGPSQLEFNLPYEFHDYITEDKDKYFYDYAMIDLIRDEEGNVSEMDLLAVAVPKEIMANYMRMFKRAGLKLVMAAPENRALENVAKYLKPEMTEGDYALLDLGAGATRIDIFSKGIYEVTRSIDIGCHSIAQLVADVFGCDPHKAEMYMEENKDNVLENEQCRDLYSRIAIDVMRAINYYTFENRDNTLEKMYYYGGGARIRPLIEEIAETIQLELVPFSEVTDGDQVAGDAVMNGAAAAGICWNQ